ncbi:serine/threonine-protein kinase Nek1 isoform X1 [Engraulis encrasicolus]
MKNLVLKIIRGSYPPVSMHYSQDLRCLLGLLFRRNPRERPSVCTILDKSFLSRRIHKFLTPQLIAQEFSHAAILKSPKPSVAHSQAAKRPASGPAAVSPAQKITKPAAKYGVPLNGRRASDVARRPAEAAKRPVERKPLPKPKQAPPPAVPQRRVSRIEEERKKSEEAARKKRLDMMERERKQREQMFLLKAAQLRRFEKEKLNRINRAREQGWRHVLSSSGGSSPERKFYGGGGMVGPSAAQAPAQPPNRYEHYLSALDQLAKPQDGAKAAGDVLARGGQGAGALAQPNGPSAPAEGEPMKMDQAKLEQVSRHDNNNNNRLRGQVPAQRAFQVEEFLQRKREAMLNKVRAEGQLGTRHHWPAIFGSRSGSIRCRRPRVNKEEEEYLSRLRQIRLQNFNERQQIKARLRGEKYDSDGSDSHESSEEAELRKRKIEALKAQANARAAVIKEQLEKKRREAYEREKKAWEDHLVARGVKMTVGAAVASPALPDPPPQQQPAPAPAPAPSPTPPASPAPSPKPTVPAISMTAALKDVGALASGQNSPMKVESPKTEAPIAQSEKKEILRRLNESLRAQSQQLPDKSELANSVAPEGPSPTPLPLNQPMAEEERPATGGDRKRWEAGAPPVFPVAQQTLDEASLASPASQCVSPEERLPSGGDRRKWEMAAPPFLPVAQQTLEETSITTPEQTAGEVIRLEPWGQDQQGQGQVLSPRRGWRQSPDSQVIEALQEAQLQPLTQLMGNTSISDRPVTDSLPPSVLPSPGQEGVKPAPQAQPSPPAPHTQAEPGEPITSEVKGQGEVLQLEDIKLVTKSEEDDELESLVLEEGLQWAVNRPSEAFQAWGAEASLAGPPGGKVSPHMPKKEQEQEQAERVEKPAEPTVHVPPSEEPLFMRLCSPAHRRAVALSMMSAQSSFEDSSSSVASRSRSVSPMRGKHQDSLLIGLSTGLFDANNPKMLRTCSLPDLSKLFKSGEPDDAAVAGGQGTVAPDNNNLEIEDLEENGKADEQSEPEDDAYEDEEEDLRELRASMERLLQDNSQSEEEDEDEEEEDEPSNGSPVDEEDGCLNGVDGRGGAEKASLPGSPDEEEEEEGVDGVYAEATDKEEEEEEEEDEEEGASPSSSSPDEEPMGPLTNGVGEGEVEGEERMEEGEEGEERHSSDGDQLNEEWQSDDSGEEEADELEQQDSIFSRLEELRFQLEQEMGFEAFIQAYNKIKAIHEDEDENIDMGPSMLQSILGTEHQHLYPKILHLVMADGAYQEDNDE